MKDGNKHPEQEQKDKLKRDAIPTPFTPFYSLRLHSSSFHKNQHKKEITVGLCKTRGNQEALELVKVEILIGGLKEMGSLQRTQGTL